MAKFKGGKFINFINVKKRVTIFGQFVFLKKKHICLETLEMQSITYGLFLRKTIPLSFVHPLAISTAQLKYCIVLIEICPVSENWKVCEHTHAHAPCT